MTAVISRPCNQCWHHAYASYPARIRRRVEPPAVDWPASPSVPGSGCSDAGYYALDIASAFDLMLDQRLAGSVHNTHRAIMEMPMKVVGCEPHFPPLLSGRRWVRNPWSWIVGAVLSFAVPGSWLVLHLRVTAVRNHGQGFRICLCSTSCRNHGHPRVSHASTMMSVLGTCRLVIFLFRVDHGQRRTLEVFGLNSSDLCLFGIRQALILA